MKTYSCPSLLRGKFAGHMAKRENTEGSQGTAWIEIESIGSLRLLAEYQRAEGCIERIPRICEGKELPKRLEVVVLAFIQGF